MGVRWTQDHNISQCGAREHRGFQHRGKVRGVLQRQEQRQRRKRWMLQLWKQVASCPRLPNGKRSWQERRKRKRPRNLEMEAFLQRKRQGKVPQQRLRQELWQEGQRQEPLVHWNESPGPSRRHSGSHYFDFIVFAQHPLRQGQDPVECCRQDDTREACDPHLIRGRRLHVPEESQQGLRYIYDELYGWECHGRDDQAREAALLQLSDLPQHLHGWSILLCER